MNQGQYVWASPEVTGLKERVRGLIIKVRQNPFIGTEIAIKDDEGRIFFGAQQYFTFA